MVQQIGISELRLTDNAEDVLATYSLGSCIGLALYDPAVRIGGMVHCMLPTSRTDPEKARNTPAMFVDTGVAALLQGMFDRGAKRRRIVAKIAGGAQLLDEKGFFKIGERNYTVVRKMLWKNEILIAAEDTGGGQARSLFLHVDSGNTFVRSNGVKRAL